MNASIVIVNYNGGAELVRDLKQVRAEAPEAAYEILLVDNASSDGSVEAVRASIPSVRILSEPVNRGFSAGVNRGLAAAVGDVVVLLNPDAVPEAGALDTLVDAVRGHPEFGVLGGVITSPTGGVDVCSARKLPVLNDILWEGFFLPKRRTRAYRRLVEETSTEPLPVEAVSGAAMAILRSHLDLVGPMNEHYFLYNEDVEWCERSGRVGLPVAVVPQARFVHRQGSTTRRDEAIPFAARMLADFQFFVELRGVSVRSVQWRWVIRQRFRQLFYAVDAIVGSGARRARARIRTRVYGRLAAQVRNLRWTPARDGQSAHPDRLSCLAERFDSAGRP